MTRNKEYMTEYTPEYTNVYLNQDFSQQQTRADKRPRPAAQTNETGHGSAHRPPATPAVRRISRLPEAKMAVCFCLLVGAALLAARSSVLMAAGHFGWMGFALIWLALTASLTMMGVLLRDSIRQTEAARAHDAAQSRIGGLLESLPCAFFALDTQGRLTYANAQAERFLQNPRLSLQSKTLQEILPPTLPPAFTSQCQNAAAARTPVQFECHDETVLRWYDVGVAPVEEGLSITISDITPRKQVEESQARLLAILEATPDLIAINDMRGKICYFNRAGREMLGLPGASDEDAASATQAEHAPALPGIGNSDLQDDVFPIGLESGVWQGEMALRTRHGRTVPVSQVVIAHKGPDGKLAYLSTIARDITARKQSDALMEQNLTMIGAQKNALEEQQAELIQKNELVARTCAELETANSRLKSANAQLEAQATTDGLTGLKNHRAFQDRLAQEFDRSARYHSPLSLLLLDVDKFKQYNDKFGHPAGDAVLKQVAQILQASARMTDLAARYGGEEFVLILPDTDEAGAVEAGERVRTAIESAGWDKRAITVSVGAASMRPGTADVAALIGEADKALYICKNFGRNCVTHHDVLLNALVHSGGEETQEAEETNAFAEV